MAITTYLRNPKLKAEGVIITFTEEQALEYLKCKDDPIYFLEHYMKIVNVDKATILFKMWDFQKDYIRALQNNRFIIAKWPRQSSKCVCLNTPIRLRNKKTGEVVETTIGEFYEQNKRMRGL